MVAANSAIGALFAVGGYNKEVVIVADEGHLVFYSSKTMLKIRSQRVAEARIVGVNAVSVHDAKEGTQHHVHAVDTLGNYYVVDVVTNYVIVSTKMIISNVAKSDKPVIGGRGGANNTADSVLSAQWTSTPNQQIVSEDDAIVPSDLRVVLLTPNGVYAQHAAAIVADNKTVVPFNKILAFPGAMPELVMSVGVENGLVLVGQRHRTWMWVTSAADGVASPKGAPLRHLSLSARLMSVAVTPLNNSTAFAIGGDRGEIAFYPTANIDTNNSILANNSNIAAPDMTAPLRFFSDHWHSTPLQAVAFTEDGRSLLSAAAERALVAWSVSGAFTRSKIMSSRREELSEGYLWRSHADQKEKKGDKKSRFRPKVRRNGEAEGQTFLTTDIASIVIPHAHGAVATAASPFTTNAAGCYVVGVTGQVAAMDLREQKVAASADGVRWSLSADAAVGINAVPQKIEAIEWMGRPALLIVSAADSEVRVVDPITQQSLYTHHVRFNMETSLVNNTNIPTSQKAANESSSAMERYFSQNKEALERTNARGTIGGLLATVADGGRVVFTYEDLTHLGLDSVLRVWRYDASKQQHIEVQAIHNPHSTEMLKMKAVTISVPRSGKKAAEEDIFDAVTMLFTLDRNGVKCWRSVELPKHESRALGSAQRAYLHLGGTAGANGEKEADAFIWRVVGSNRCASGRASTFELADDGTVLLVADEVVRAYEVPITDLSLAFTPHRQGRGFAVTDWETLFALPPSAKKTTAASIASLRFITEASDQTNSALPCIFARYADGYGCCWTVDADATWSVGWESAKIHSLLQASLGDAKAPGVTLSVALAEQSNAGIALAQVTIPTKGSASTKIVTNLPKPNGSVQYVVLPSAIGASSSVATTFDGRLMSLDGAGVRHVPVIVAADKEGTKNETVETFEQNKDRTVDKRLDIFFSKVNSDIAADAAVDDDNATTAADGKALMANVSPSTQQLLSKVLGSEAYASPPMGLVLSSLLAANQSLQ